MGGFHRRNEALGRSRLVRDVQSLVLDAYAPVSVNAYGHAPDNTYSMTLAYISRQL